MFPPVDNSDQDALGAVRDLLRLGLVLSVDLAAARCVVQLDEELITGPIPWGAARAGRTKIWCAPSVGEQVLVYAPEGDLERAMVGAGFFYDASTPPANDNSTTIEFEDGARIAYAPDAHKLTVILAADGAAELVAPGGVSIAGDVSITGDVDVTGQVQASVDVKAGDISLKNHPHDKVQAGQALSGKPQP
ncbi:phage baseplate assembly protein V [Brevundimonas nasdae]|uniref:phage baseplate assembly protein V n=1 Tax=Brevundimonas nasdae TaxID=172043 RepID=UPI003F6916D9